MHLCKAKYPDAPSERDAGELLLLHRCEASGLQHPRIEANAAGKTVPFHGSVATDAALCIVREKAKQGWVKTRPADLIPFNHPPQTSCDARSLLQT